MDTALLLRKHFDKKDALSDDKINDLLERSLILKKMTKDSEENAFFHIFRLICLSEIPYVERLPYVGKVISYVSENLSTGQGFSYTGHLDYIVPCYNAMLMEAYTRLGRLKSKEAQAALDWIKRYQVFERNQSTSWQHEGICKHGGCMRTTPCYIGIGKTVRALITYAEFTEHRDEEVEELIDKGIAYILRHNMYQRLSNSKPISPHILDVMFPQSYMLSLTDLVYIANKRDLWRDERTDQLKQLLKEKEVGPKQWKIDYIYSHKGYKAFETRRNPSEWIGYLFSSKSYCGKEDDSERIDNNAI